MESQVKQEHPTPPDNHPDLVKWRGWWPGKAGLAMADRGHIPGCAFKIFGPEARGTETVMADTVANEWFMANQGLLIGHISFYGQYILIVYSKTLDPIEFGEMDSLMREARELKDQRDAERKELEEKNAAAQEEASKAAAEKRAAEEKELRRLADLGRRHEKNCGHKKGA